MPCHFCGCNERSCDLFSAVGCARYTGELYQVVYYTRARRRGFEIFAAINREEAEVRVYNWNLSYTKHHLGTRVRRRA